MVWTPDKLTLRTIPFDEEAWKQTFKRLEIYYFEKYLPLAIAKANGKLVPDTVNLEGVEGVLPLGCTLHASAPQEAPATAAAEAPAATVVESEPAAEAPAATVVESEPLVDSMLHAPVLQDARVAIFASAEAQASTSEEDSSEGFNEEEESSSDDSAHDDSDSPESETLTPEELEVRRVQRFFRRKLGPQ